MIELYKRYLRFYKKEVIIGPLFKLLEAVFELIVPLIMAKIIDYGINGADKQYIYKMGGVLILVAVIGLSTTLVCQYLAAKASQGFGTRLREATFNHIETFGFAELDKYGVSTLLTRMNNDINQLQLSVAMLIRLVIRAPFLVVGASIMSFFISPIFALIFIAGAIIVLTVVLLIMKRTIPYNKKVQKDLENVTTVAKENLSGARVVRAFNMQNNEDKRFENEVKVLQKDAIRVGRISALLNPVSTIVINACIILVLYLGGNYVNSGSISQGDITALINYLNQILVATMVVCNLIVIFGKAITSGSRVLEILDTKPSLNTGTIVEKKQNVPLFEFQNVDFKYPSSSKNALSNLNFSINEGEFIGIVGGTGSGKSTLLSLLAHFYDCTNGEIKYAGNDIKNYDSKYFNNEIGIVLQKALLANQTIRDNLSWGNQSASDADLEEALKISQAYDFVMKKEEGLDRLIMQGGKNLSGGERQRLSIARALVKKPNVLMLDDSLSALDFKTDFELRKALSKLNITIIMVTERLSSIKNADKIIVLDNGKISGVGTNDWLLENNLIYKEIYESQVRED